VHLLVCYLNKLQNARYNDKGDQSFTFSRIYIWVAAYPFHQVCIEVAVMHLKYELLVDCVHSALQVYAHFPYLHLHLDSERLTVHMWWLLENCK